MPLKPDSRQLLRQLGAGRAISQICQEQNWTEGDFAGWWKAELAARTPNTTGARKSSVRSGARSDRDEMGIPHISADNDEDLFHGFGYAMAQDRLFQLDYLRRKAKGELAAVLGEPSVESDLLSRTVGLTRIAQAEWDAASPETRQLLSAFAAGVNGFIEQAGEKLPIEFGLLDYRPAPWTPLDSLAIEGEFRWYLTGRFPVLVIPELARRALKDDGLFAAFLTSEAEEESILPAGTYPTASRGAQPLPNAPLGSVDPQAAEGSNNWVVSGSHAVAGKPLLASDPHIAFAAVSCWYQVHLCGGSFNVAGMAYAGMPAVMFGRNPEVAWGCTNNICSQRDLYQERVDPAHAGCFLYDGKWEPARETRETIQVKGQPALEKTIRHSRNGPIVTELLPGPARGLETVSLKWLGAYPCGWLPALLAMNRARTSEELRQATRPWLVPTFSLVFCDSAGQIGYQCTGRLPIRAQRERGYRPGWDPAHQWAGLIPFEGLPACTNPQTGFVASANNRPAPDDFPYPLSGVWSSGHRARRIRQMLEERPRHTCEDMQRMQHDVVSLRAVDCAPRVLALLADEADPRLRAALECLRGWDGGMTTDSVAATVFDVFFSEWSRRVAEARFQGELAGMVAGAIGGLASALLIDDPAGWFAEGARRSKAGDALRATVETLTAQLGPETKDWTWGRLHRLTLRHPLSGLGDLGQLFDEPAAPVGGDMITVCNTGNDPAFQAASGAGYRMIADLSVQPPELLAIDAGSQSGVAGSPHYADQAPAWLAGRYHRLPLDPDRARQAARATLKLEPRA